MPAVSVMGMPANTGKRKLRKLRADLIRAFELGMGIKTGMTRVFFPMDMLGDPDEGQDTLIWVFLYTGMFEGKPDSDAKYLTNLIADLMFKALGKNFGVEVFVVSLDQSTKTIIEP